MIKLKEVAWIGSAKKDLRDFPKNVQREIGFALHQVQEGKHPMQAKPLHGLGSGILEIVCDYDTNTYRAVYAVKLGDRVFVLHTFQKKSKSGIKTPKQDIDLIKQRLAIAKAYERQGET